jgi:hypothetical protein
VASNKPSIGKVKEVDLHLYRNSDLYLTLSWWDGPNKTDPVDIEEAALVVCDGESGDVLLDTDGFWAISENVAELHVPHTEIAPLALTDSAAWDMRLTVDGKQFVIARGTCFVREGMS